MKSTIAFIGLLFIKFSLLPGKELLFWMFFAILLDLISGVSKAYILKQARTSEGFRKTISKFLQYGGGLVVGVILTHAAEQSNQLAIKGLLGYFNDAFLVFVIYIEVTSIFENLYACDNKSMVSKYFFTPVLKLLTFQIKNNPAVKAAEGLKDQTKTEAS